MSEWRLVARSSSACPTIDRPGKRRFPLLKGAGYEHGIRSVRTKGDVGDVRRRDVDRAHQPPVLAHNQDAPGAVLRDVVVTVGTELHTVRPVVGVLVPRRWREILQARPYRPRAELAVRPDRKRENTSREHLGDQQMLPSLARVSPFE